MIEKFIKLTDSIDVYHADIGRVGDYNVIKITFDFSDYREKYGEGTPMLMFSPPYSSTSFPVVIDNDSWVVSESETIRSGTATAQIKWLVNGENALKVSPIIQCRIKDGIKPEGEMPDPVKSWVDEATRVLGENVAEVNKIPEKVATEVESYVTEHKEDLKGEPGTDGYTPVKNKDYFDGKDGYTPVKGKDYFDGEPGKDYTLTESDKEEIASKVHVEEKHITEYIENPYNDKEIRKDVTEVKGELSTLSTSKISKPEDAPQVGKVLKIKSVNDDGTFVCEWADAGAGNVNDVRIDGTSILDEDKNANFESSNVETADVDQFVKYTDYPKETKAGVIKPSVNYGSVVDANTGIFYGWARSEEQYKNGPNGIMICKGTLENIKESLVKSVVDKPWVLKGTITNPSDKASVDLVGCSELLIRASATVTGNTSIRTDVSASFLSGFFTTSRKKAMAHFVDSAFGFMCDYTGYSGVDTANSVIQNVSVGYSSIGNAFISDIKKIYFTDASTVTDCNIEIYAR